jgi:hypothetical protein
LPLPIQVLRTAAEAFMLAPYLAEISRFRPNVTAGYIFLDGCSQLLAPSTGSIYQPGFTDRMR